MLSPGGAALAADGAVFEEIVLDRTVHSVIDVQVACGCRAEQVLKTLVLAGSRPALVVLPGDRRLDLRALTVCSADAPLRFATRSEVPAITGQEVGTLSPFGGFDGLRRLADVRIRDLDVVIAGSGEQRVLLRLAGAEFARRFRGEFLDLA